MVVAHHDCGGRYLLHRLLGNVPLGRFKLAAITAAATAANLRFRRLHHRNVHRRSNQRDDFLGLGNDLAAQIDGCDNDRADNDDVRHE